MCARAVKNKREKNKHTGILFSQKAREIYVVGIVIIILLFPNTVAQIPQNTVDGISCHLNTRSHGHTNVAQTIKMFVFISHYSNNGTLGQKDQLGKSTATCQTC